MHVAVCVAEIAIPGAESLKDKRNVLQSVKARLRREFNVGVSEVAAQSARDHGVLGIVSVSGDARYLAGQVSRIEEALDRWTGGALLWFEHAIEQHGPGEGFKFDPESPDIPEETRSHS